MSYEQLEKLIEQQTHTLLKNRAEERLEDIKKISDLVVSQVSSELEPMKKRQAEFEEFTIKRCDNMAEAITNLQQIVTGSPNPPPSLPSTSFPPLPSQSAQPLQPPTWQRVLPAPSIHVSSPQPRPSSPAVNRTLPSTDTLQQKFETGRLTLGFEPIEMRDLSRLSRMHDIHDQELLMKLAILEYIKLDLTIKTLDTSNIVKVFTQAGKTDSNVNRFYAQFDSLATVSLIWKHVLKLSEKPDHHVMIYVPSAFQNQLRHLDHIAYQLRNPPAGTERSRTRILYGPYSLLLQQKSLTAKNWRTVPVENLPLGDNYAGTAVSDSPPPGRQRDSSPPPSNHDYQENPSIAKRAASSSPVDHRDLKQARKVSEVMEKVDLPAENDTISLETSIDAPEAVIASEPSLN